MGRWHAQCHYRLYISLRRAPLGKHSVRSWCFNYSSHCSPVQKYCCAEEDQQDTHPLNFSFLLAIQLPYSYLVSTAKSGDTDPPLALGKLGQEGHKVKASLGYETKTLSQRNENNLIKITAGWYCLAWLGKLSPKPLPRQMWEAIVEAHVFLNLKSMWPHLRPASLDQSLSVHSLTLVIKESLLHLLFTELAQGPR